MSVALLNLLLSQQFSAVLAMISPRIISMTVMYYVLVQVLCTRVLHYTGIILTCRDIFRKWYSVIESAYSTFFCLALQGTVMSPHAV